MTTAVSPQSRRRTSRVTAQESRRLLRRRVARAENRPLCRHASTQAPAQSLGKVAESGADDIDAAVAAAKIRVQGMAASAATRARQDSAANRRNPASERQRTRDDRCRRLRQSGQGDGQRRHDRRRADRVLRRLRHGDERRLDPDGSGRRQFLSARAAEASSGALSHSITRSCSVRANLPLLSPPAIPWS